MQSSSWSLTYTAICCIYKYAETACFKDPKKILWPLLWDVFNYQDFYLKDFSCNWEEFCSVSNPITIRCVCLPLIVCDCSIQRKKFFIDQRQHFSYEHSICTWILYQPSSSCSNSSLYLQWLVQEKRTIVFGIFNILSFSRHCLFLVFSAFLPVQNIISLKFHCNKLQTYNLCKNNSNSLC